MIAFLVSEASFFGTLIMAYVFFLSQTIAGNPKPSQVFHLPLVLAASCVCFRAARRFIWRKRPCVAIAAERSSVVGIDDRAGSAFPVGTMWEWSELIGTMGLDHQPQPVRDDIFHTGRISRAARVDRRDRDEHHLWSLPCWTRSPRRNNMAVEVVSWYWHFVDAVWLLVFTLVYWWAAKLPDRCSGILIAEPPGESERMTESSEHSSAVPDRASLFERGNAAARQSGRSWWLSELRCLGRDGRRILFYRS